MLAVGRYDVVGLEVVLDGALLELTRRLAVHLGLLLGHLLLH